jgi:hypothetical protein
LEECIELYLQALDLQPTPHPDRSGSLNNLANALSRRFEQKGQFSDLEESMTHFANASTYSTGSLTARLRVSRTWARIAVRHGHESAMRAFHSAIYLLPQIASLDLNIQRRIESLSQARGVASDACWCAVRNEALDTAVESLSAGRAIFWSQVLHLRSPIDNLAETEPKLATQLREVSNALEAAAFSDGVHLTSDILRTVSDEQRAQRARQLADKRDELLISIRKLTGFEDFLLPKPISKLRAASTDGPVIFLNASKYGCDALLMKQDGTEHFPLELSFDEVHDLTVSMRGALLSTASDSDNLSAARCTVHRLLRGDRAPYLTSDGPSKNDEIQEVL